MREAEQAKRVGKARMEEAEKPSKKHVSVQIYILIFDRDYDAGRQKAGTQLDQNDWHRR
jgi:hypothetical protein